MKTLEGWSRRASILAKLAGDDNSTGGYYLMINGAETLFDIAKPKEAGVTDNKAIGQGPRGQNQAIISDKTRHSLHSNDDTYDDSDTYMWL